MLSTKARVAVRHIVDPLGHALARAGITANALTLAGLALSIVAGALIGTGWGRLGGAATLLAGLPDMLDGAVAKASGSAGDRGAFLDSVVDRLSDGAVLLGVVWLAADTDQPRLAILAAAVLTFSQVVSYARARAQSLGFTCDVGIAERPVRVIVLALSLIVGVLEIGLWLLAVATAVTVAQRIHTVMQQASVRQ